MNKNSEGRMFTAHGFSELIQLINAEYISIDTESKTMQQNVPSSHQLGKKKAKNSLSRIAQPGSSKAEQTKKKNKGSVENASKIETKLKRTRRRERNKKPKNLTDQEPSTSTNLTFVNNRKPKSLNLDEQKASTSTGSSHSVNTKKPKALSKSKLEIKYTFIIRPVWKASSCFLRKRNTKYKYVNLKSFTKTSKCVTFVTKTSLYDKLRLKSKGKKPYKKCLKRKYFPSVQGENFSVDSIHDPLVELQTQKHPIAQPDEITITSDLNNLQIQKPPMTLKSKRHSLQHKNEEAKSPEKKHFRRKRNSKKSNTLNFPDYLSLDEVLSALSKNELVKGFIRVNPKNSKDSYVSNEDSTQPDYYITSIIDRNRAMEGDEVVLKVKPETDWLEGKGTASVVHILNMVHPRIAVGTLRKKEKDSEFAEFRPRDKRIPVIWIPAVSWPNGFKDNPKQYEKVLFVAKIKEWSNPLYALGYITESLGLSGDLRVETISILREFCLDVTPFSSDVVDFLSESKSIPEDELHQREDLRQECVFTIDPLTARDLDDAVSAKKLENGNYEIGVHISDASFYLEEGTELDQAVSQKATTIYLVDNVYHMLPVELCLHCSLLPGEDKLAMSVFWEINDKGEIVNTRFTRTVINSCTQLAYEHAQMMIEDPSREFKESELPKIYNGFTPKDLSETVNVLQRIAINLREKRVKDGALRIDQAKLLFSLHADTGEPLDFRIYENKEAHRLIEEFMLLANISVAQKIYDTLPHLAFLRCHDPPKNTMLAELQNNLATCGIHIDISSSGGINSTMRKYITDDFPGLCRGAVLNHLFAKPMTRARYFCAATEEEFNHYALSVPIYTHFTSPIRRYADIMVHRLLAASLGYSEEPEWDADYVSAVAANCNAQKYNAKRAGEASSDLYLAHYIEQHQPYIQDCVVVEVRERSFDAIVLSTGSVVRVYQNTCEDSPRWKIEAVPSPKLSEENGPKSEHEKRVLKLTLTYPESDLPETSLVIEIFTSVKVKLQWKPNTYKLEATLLRPFYSSVFTSS